MTQRAATVPAFQRRRGVHHLLRAQQTATLHHATLLEAKQLSARVRLLRFCSRSLGPSWQPGDRILIEVSDTRRAYTLARVCMVRGTFDLFAVTHDAGPGGRWARDILPGEDITLFGSKPDLDVQTRGASRIVLLGDETSLGLFAAVGASARRGQTISGLVEFEGPTASLLGLLGPRFASVQSQRAIPGRPGAATRAWLEDHHIRPRTVYVVNGHGAAVRALRLSMLAMGIPASSLRSRAYWGRA